MWRWRKTASCRLTIPFDIKLPSLFGRNEFFLQNISVFCTCVNTAHMHFLTVQCALWQSYLSRVWPAVLLNVLWKWVVRSTDIVSELAPVILCWILPLGVMSTGISLLFHCWKYNDHSPCFLYGFFHIIFPLQMRFNSFFIQWHNSNCKFRRQFLCDWYN